MKTSSRNKSALLVLATLALSGCPTLDRVGEVQISPPPAHIQFVYRVDKLAFYGVDSETGKRYTLKYNDSEMNGAQCLVSEDFKRMEAYIDYLEQAVRTNCR